MPRLSSRVLGWRGKGRKCVDKRARVAFPLPPFQKRVSQSGEKEEEELSLCDAWAVFCVTSGMKDPQFVLVVEHVVVCMGEKWRESVKVREG